jgi:hypothetical protein
MKLRDKFKYFGKVRNSSSLSSSSSEMMSQVTASQLEAQAAPVLWLVQCAAYGTIVPYSAQRTAHKQECTVCTYNRTLDLKEVQIRDFGTSYFFALISVRERCVISSERVTEMIQFHDGQIFTIFSSLFNYKS